MHINRGERRASLSSRGSSDEAELSDDDGAPGEVDLEAVPITHAATANQDDAACQFMEYVQAHRKNAASVLDDRRAVGRQHFFHGDFDIECELPT